MLLTWKPCAQSERGPRPEARQRLTCYMALKRSDCAVIVAASMLIAVLSKESKGARPPVASALRGCVVCCLPLPPESSNSAIVSQHWLASHGAAKSSG